MRHLLVFFVRPPKPLIEKVRSNFQTLRNLKLSLRKIVSFIQITADGADMRRDIQAGRKIL